LDTPPLIRADGPILIFGAVLAEADRLGIAPGHTICTGDLTACCGDPVTTIELVLFPEMDTSIDVPEITTACWSILGKSPTALMCATSRMVVKRKGADRPVVLSCTLLPYDSAPTLGLAKRRRIG
jgi:hypothetical protein